eukprot:TRINITY_DN2676_c0_g1_i7.p1 TRINITY_DN2676_c0_g1~~TRINITY_DN2676_c0_g1_i7.p1  ORF type:complete len:1103 (-),score=224.79 TRINITY_DN2676_c0_g1_i7:373-3381(-)
MYPQAYPNQGPVPQHYAAPPPQYGPGHMQYDQTFNMPMNPAHRPSFPQPMPHDPSEDPRYRDYLPSPVYPPGQGNYHQYDQGKYPPNSPYRPVDLKSPSGPDSTGTHYMQGVQSRGMQHMPPQPSPTAHTLVARPRAPLLILEPTTTDKPSEKTTKTPKPQADPSSQPALTPSAKESQAHNSSQSVQSAVALAPAKPAHSRLVIMDPVQPTAAVSKGDAEAETGTKGSATSSEPVNQNVSVETTATDGSDQESSEANVSASASVEAQETPLKEPTSEESIVTEDAIKSATQESNAQPATEVQELTTSSAEEPKIEELPLEISAPATASEPTPVDETPAPAAVVVVETTSETEILIAEKSSSSSLSNSSLPTQEVKSSSGRILPISQLINLPFVQLPRDTIHILYNLSLYNPVPQAASLQHSIPGRVVRQSNAKATPATRGIRKPEEPSTIRECRSMVNKITPTTYDNILEKIKLLKIDSIATMEGIITTIFETAVRQPLYCPVYAKLCQDLSTAFPRYKDENEKEITFKKILLNTCQVEFERELLSPDPSLSEEDQFIFRKKERGRQLGNIRLISDIYKTGMLPDEIITECISTLTQADAEGLLEAEAIECLCQLLLNAGKRFVESPQKSNAATCDEAFAKLKTISTSDSYDRRIRFMCLDTIEARANDWTPRIKQTGPKHIKEVHQEALDEAKATEQRVKELPRTQYEKQHVNTGPNSASYSNYIISDKDTSLSSNASAGGKEVSLRPGFGKWSAGAKASSAKTSTTFSPAGKPPAKPVSATPAAPAVPTNRFTNMAADRFEAEFKGALKAFIHEGSIDELVAKLAEMKSSQHYNQILHTYWECYFNSNSQEHPKLDTIAQELIKRDIIDGSVLKESLSKHLPALGGWVDDFPNSIAVVASMVAAVIKKGTSLANEVLGKNGVFSKCCDGGVEGDAILRAGAATIKELSKKYADAPAEFAKLISQIECDPTKWAEQEAELSEIAYVLKSQGVAEFFPKLKA